MRQIPSSSIDDKPRERLFVAENPNEEERVRSGRRRNESDRTKRRPLFSKIYLCCNFIFERNLFIYHILVSLIIQLSFVTGIITLCIAITQYMLWDYEAKDLPKMTWDNFVEKFSKVESVSS